MHHLNDTHLFTHFKFGFCRRRPFSPILRVNERQLVSSLWNQENTMAGNGERHIKITESELKAVISSTVAETLIRMGIDSEKPLDMQKDFNHLRKHRESVEAVKKNAWVKGVGFLLVVGLGIILKFFTGE